MPMCEDTLEHSLPDLAALLCALALHACNGKFALIFGKPPDLGTSGEARVEEEARDTNRQADRTVDDL